MALSRLIPASRRLDPATASGPAPRSWVESPSSALTARLEALGFTEAHDLRAQQRRLHEAAGYVWGCALLALLYYLAAKLGYVFEFTGPVAGIVWLPVGVAISYLSLRGLRFWPGALVGDLLANDYSTVAIGGAVGQTAGNMLEVLIASLLIRRLVRRGAPLESIGGVVRMLGALALGTAVSAVVGPSSLMLDHVLSPASLPDVTRTWWLGDFCGALVVVPLALAWFARSKVDVTRARVLEAIGVLGLVALLGSLAVRSGSPLTYLVFPALILAAIRFGQRGATLAVAVSVGIVVWATTHYHGPFVYHSITRSVLSTQLFIAVAAVTSICLAALVSERARFAEQLSASRLEVLRAAQAERHRLERDLHDGAQQRLLALSLRLGLATQRPDTVDDLLLEHAEAELQLAIDELRQLSHGIHPSVLTELGLAGAMQSVIARSTVPVTVLAMPDAPADIESEAAAYYVLTETIANTQKHARASAVTVSVRSTANEIRVVTEDDGVGAASETKGSGLTGLRERVEAMGGSFDVRSLPGQGTRVIAVIPARPR